MIRWYEFGASDWDRIESMWSAWWNGTLDRPLVTGFIRDPGTQPPEGDDFLTRFPLDTPAEAIVDHFERRLSTIQYYGDAYPKYWVNFGAGVIAAFLGSGVEYNT
ncbi:MAG: hypothetical protein K8I30_20955, partial [Anaerolineae bacterium]|nr:hypothetical protein [Anaerolineae bacterium]